MAKKVVIIGGVAGGASAAARLRRLDEEAVIIMLEKGQFISYANCGLPYHIGGVIRDRETLVVQTPEKLRAKFNIDVRVNSEVLRINRQDKTVEVRDTARDRIYTETYDKLVIATGAEPVIPDIPGIRSGRIFTLRNIPDTVRIKELVDRGTAKRAVLVGAGYIGLEVAENLANRGIKVTVVELADQVMASLDFEMAAIVHQHLKSKQVELYLGESVRSFSENDGHITAYLKNGKELKADFAVIGTGVRPDNRLATEAGLETGQRGGIVVDGFLRTSDIDIYAVGDVIETNDYVNGTRTQIPLAGPANRQGRMAADNIAGRSEKYAGTIGTSIVKLFDITAAATGNNEKTLKKTGIDYEKSYTHAASHAGYYPGAIPMSIKLLFGRQDGRILGAQIVGYEGVDKRIDVISTAIYGKMTVHDLEKLELAYAPPFSSAKDPVNIAGYVASNILKGDVKVFHWDEVSKIDTIKDLLLDVRPREEYMLGHIQGAVNIPVMELRHRMNEIPSDKTIYVYCNTGLNSYAACRMLTLNGYPDVKNLSGSMMTYEMTTHKQSNEDIYEYDRIRKDDEFIKVGSPEQESFADADIEADACGLQCPGPILKVYENIANMEYGKVLHLTASDPAFENDVRAWCETTGNKLLNFKYEDKKFHAYIKKQIKDKQIEDRVTGNDKTMVVMSGDLDKALAAFLIANGALATGRKVTMFFTFWGLNILRKSEHVKVRKDMLSRMFGMMMPRGAGRTKLSKLSMGGLGGMLIKRVMKKKNIASLDELISLAVSNGARLIACSMTMDMMGIKGEELIDGIEHGGVATFLGSAENSDTTLFIS